VTPLEQVQIDHHASYDLIVVDEATGQTDWRPYLTIATTCLPACVLGWVVTLKRRHSGFGSACCLVHVPATKRPPGLERSNIEMEWPMAQSPGCSTGNRGEFKRRSALRRGCEAGMASGFELSPARAAALTGRLVERTHRHGDADVHDELPGDDLSTLTARQTTIRKQGRPDAA